MWLSLSSIHDRSAASSSFTSNSQVIIAARTLLISTLKSTILSLALALTLFQGANVKCFGPLVGVRYSYHYETDLQLFNTGQPHHEPAGFGLTSRFTFENVWQDETTFLAAIHLDSVQFKPRANAKSGHADGPEISSWPTVLANVNGYTGRIKALYVAKDKSGHASGHLLEPTHLNLLVSLLSLLQDRFDASRSSNPDGRNLQFEYHNNETTSASLLAPQIEDRFFIEKHLVSDHDIPEQVTGWQNVSLSSKIYPTAHSKLSTTFQLKLESETPTGSKLSASTLPEAIHKFGQGTEMVPLNLHFIAERKPCGPHFCKGLTEFVEEYRDQLAEDKALASTGIGVAYLRLLSYIRTQSASITRKDVGKLLKTYFKSRHQDGNVFITILDAVAGSRHGEAMMAAFNFLDLAKCTDSDSADICERFLVGVAVSAITTANMGSSYIVEHSLSAEQLVDLFLPLSTSPKWADERVKHAYGMTLATLLNSFHVFVRNQDTKGGVSSHIFADHLIAQHSSPALFVDVTAQGEENKAGHHHEKVDIGEGKKASTGQTAHRLGVLSDKVLKYLIHELDACKDTDCRIVYLHALGNARLLSKQGVLHVFKKYTTTSGKRESVAAIRALRDCIEFARLSGNAQELSDKVLTRLRQLLIRVVYDSNLETTTRLVAAELLAKYIDHNGQITAELVQHLDTFPPELATMIWKRAVLNLRARLQMEPARSSDWQLHSKTLSGSSASFKYVMGGTGHANASYGVFLELLKGKLPKETSFNVEINSGNLTQDVITVGLFARGLASFAGGDDSGEAQNEVATEEDESTLAGMTLQVLGNQLRPFLFFRSTSELMGHLWSGAASEPTPVFRDNLLIADYLDVRPLVSGLLVEQSLKGVFSVDLSGEVQVSLWNRNSHSNVQTRGAILLQGSQEVYTTDQKTSAHKFFSFGGESRLNFITDFDFYSSPYRICIQITQPEFVFRHNTRKYEQVHSDALHRRIHRRSYKIPAKSYVLNRDNSKMCAAMNAESD